MVIGYQYYSKRGGGGMKKRLKILLPVLVILLVAAGIYSVFFKKQIDPNTIKVSGNIETTTVGAGFKIAGHVAFILHKCCCVVWPGYDK